MQINFKKLNSRAVMPRKAHATDAGFDLTATSMEIDEYGNFSYGTGIAVEIPEGYVGLLFPRSSNCKQNLILTNGVGVCDSGYRGEIFFKFKIAIGVTENEDEMDEELETYGIGDRIGQLIIMPIPAIEFIETDKLSDSDRGAGGYGSTGK